MWTLSKAMIDRENLPCSRELAAESSADCYLAGEPSVPLRLISTREKSSLPDKTTDASNRFRFGTTFVHLTVDRGEELLMSYRAGFRARTSVLREKEQESPEKKADCGRSSRVSLARFDRQSCSWRTRQLSLLADSGSCLETFSRWGMMRDGELYPLKMPALHTAGSDSGLLPTLTAQNYGSNQGGSAGRVGPVRLSLQSMASRGILPTLTVCGNYNRKGASPQSGDGLATVLGGPLNPNWTEWFMGFPVGWTALDASGMPRFRQWRDSHLRF